MPGVGWPLRGAGGGYAAARLEQDSKSSNSLGEKNKRPHEGPLIFLAERVAIFAHPKESEEFRKSFSILHLAKFVTRVKRGNPAKAGSQT